MKFYNIPRRTGVCCYLLKEFFNVYNKNKYTKFQKYSRSGA